jgi:hypothetical protein
MGFFLHIEIDSSLTPAEFQAHIVVPLAEGLAREGLGRVLEEDQAEQVASGQLELAIEVTDQERARNLVEQLLGTVPAKDISMRLADRARFVVGANGPNELGLSGLCDRFVNGLSIPAHVKPDEAAGYATERFRQAVLAELDGLTVTPAQR